MKEKIKNNLEKVNFKKLSISLLIVYLLAVPIFLFINRNIGIIILLLDTVLLLIEFLLYSLKQIIDDIEKIASIIFIMLWVVLGTFELFLKELQIRII